jgi:hypothetical protein
MFSLGNKEIVYPVLNRYHNLSFYSLFIRYVQRIMLSFSAFDKIESFFQCLALSSEDSGERTSAMLLAISISIVFCLVLSS